MADITQTPANVAPGTGAVLDRVTGTIGETLVAGDVVYKDSTATNRLKKALHTSLAAADAVGIMVGGGALGQPGVYQTDGEINPGGTVTVGALYAVSANAGKIAAIGDVGSGDYLKVIGVGVSATAIRLQLNLKTGDNTPVLLP